VTLCISPKNVCVAKRIKKICQVGNLTYAKIMYCHPLQLHFKANQRLEFLGGVPFKRLFGVIWHTGKGGKN
jgi:hypothetical protein